MKKNFEKKNKFYKIRKNEEKWKVKIQMINGFREKVKECKLNRLP